jgi:hypothetical protein
MLQGASVTRTAKSSMARWRGSRSAARWFIAIISPSTGSPDSVRTAAPWAVRQ